ncbi:MAG: FtsX-like permease family protein [Clostridium sp.]
MNLIRLNKKIIISLIIAFFSINLGIGVANAAIQNTKDYYYGNPIDQTVVTLNTSFGNDVITADILQRAINSINYDENIIIGPYILNDYKESYDKETLIFFANEKFKEMPKLKEGKVFTNSNQIIIGSDILKSFNNKKVNDYIELRQKEYMISGISFSNFSNDRVNDSIILPLDNMSDILKEPYLSKEPFFLEIILNGGNSKIAAENIVTNLNELKGKYDINTEYRTFTSDYKESINPSAYIIIGFSIMILVLTIINIIILSSLYIEENYKNFAIMKAIGSYENMIALEFIKKMIFLIIISALIGYICFLGVSYYLTNIIGIGIYNESINLIISIILGILSCIISIIRPYFKIKNLVLAETLKG